MKILVLAVLFAFSSYSVTHASILSHSNGNGEGFSYLQYLSIEADAILDESEESDVPFQET